MAQGFPTNAPDVYTASELVTETKDANFTGIAARRYFLDHGSPATRIDATLPAAPATGDVIEFVGGSNTGLFRVIANTGQTIKFLSSTSGSAGYWTAVSIYSMLRVRYVGSNVWEVIASHGQFDSDGGVRQAAYDTTKPVTIGAPTLAGHAARLTDLGGGALIRGWNMGAPFDVAYVADVEGGFPVVDPTTGAVYVVAKSGIATPNIAVRKKPASGDRLWIAHDSQTAVSLSSAGLGACSYDFFSNDQAQLLLAGSSTPSVIAYRSTNGGSSWTRTTTTTGFTASTTIQAVFCQSGLIGYLVDQVTATCRFRKTTDGGVTWGAEVSVCTDAGSANAGRVDIASLDDTTIVAVYANGTVVRCAVSTNGGTSFGAPVTIHTANVNDDTLRVAVASDGTMWVSFAVGSTGYLYKSINNGANWTQMKTFTMLHGQPFSGSGLALSGTAVYAYFSSSTATQAVILQSTDAGSTWASYQFNQNSFAVSQSANDDAIIRRIAAVGDELYMTVSDGTTVYVVGFRKIPVSA